MSKLSRCDGCKHNWYSAPGGCAGKPYPHSRCLLFALDVPAVIERKVGCDGTKSPHWVRSEFPAGCPNAVGDAESAAASVTPAGAVQ